MKILGKHLGKVVAVVCVGFLLLIIFFSIHARAVAPVLGIKSTPTNTVVITILNGVTNGVYEIYFKEFLSDPNWLLIAEGNPGQTNFLDYTDVTETGFYRALNGNDFDGDGIPNFQDARPYDPSIGLMTVTIELPANGSNVQ